MTHESRGAFSGGGGGALVGVWGRIDRREDDGMSGREENEGEEQRTITQLMGLRWAWGRMWAHKSRGAFSGVGGGALMDL